MAPCITQHAARPRELRLSEGSEQSELRSSRKIPAQLPTTSQPKRPQWRPWRITQLFVAQSAMSEHFKTVFLPLSSRSVRPCPTEQTLCKRETSFSRTQPSTPFSFTSRTARSYASSISSIHAPNACHMSAGFIAFCAAKGVKLLYGYSCTETKPEGSER